MNHQASALLDNAMVLIEGVRYKFGVMEFVKAFVEQWAYLQTGMYPPAVRIPKELEPVAIKLTHILAAAMKADPTGDALGNLLIRAQFEKRGTNYFPTPSAVGQLMAEIIGAGAGADADFYEPCCGSGVNAIQWMDKHIENHGLESLAKTSIYLEDIDPLMVKCSFIQLMHYFEFINVTPAHLSIVAIDTISRIPKGVAYQATGRGHIEVAA